MSKFLETVEEQNELATTQLELSILLNLVIGYAKDLEAAIENRKVTEAKCAPPNVSNVYGQGGIGGGFWDNISNVKKG